MTEIALTLLRRSGLPQLDRVVLTILAILGVVAIFDPAGLPDRCPRYTPPAPASPATLSRGLF